MCIYMVVCKTKQAQRVHTLVPTNDLETLTCTCATGAVRTRTDPNMVRSRVRTVCTRVHTRVCRRVRTMVSERVYWILFLETLRCANG